MGGKRNFQTFEKEKVILEKGFGGETLKKRGGEGGWNFTCITVGLILKGL